MAKVRRRNWKTSKGEARTAYTVDYVDNRGARQRNQFTRWKAADKFRIRVESQLADGTHRPDANNVTVKELGERYLEYCEARMKRNERMTRKTLVVYIGHVCNYILLPQYGLDRFKLSQLTAKSVNDFRDGIRSSGVTVPTTRKILSTLHTALEFAISQDWVAVNVATGVKVIGPRSEGSKKVVAPSKTDLKAILKATDDVLRFMILFAATTGLRAGEQWAARWSDVDFKAGKLSVARRVDAYGEEGPPKSLAGIRDVPLSAELVRRLKEWNLRSNFSDNDDLIFPNQAGRFTGHDNFIKRRFKPTLLTAGVTGITWHCLRHFAISTWIEAGLAPKTVQTFAGHSGLQITMDRYGHLFQTEDHKRAMDRIAFDLV